ncbi:MAG: YibE/F family protein [Bacilli bacterium]|nr:YibE/F family protein [Bacilli bacterium]
MQTDNKKSLKEYFHNYFKTKKEEIRNYGKANLIKRLITIGVTLVLAVLFIVIFGKTTYYKNEYTIIMNETYGIYGKLIKAKVTSIDDIYYPSEDERLDYTIRITFTAEILKGDKKGQSVEVMQYLNDYTSHFYKQVKDGKRIYIVEENTAENGEPTYYFAGDSLSYNHWGGIIALVSILIILLLIISKSKGLLTIISLALTALVIVFVLLPSIINGINIYLLVLICAIYVIAVTFILVVGINKKCLCASLGCFSGLLLSGLLALITLRIINATGYYYQEGVEDVVMLFQTSYNADIIIDLKGLVFASTIIGALGAVMDVSLSLSSALKEVYDNSKETSLINTIKSGFTIGKDMIGTMVNTLILAYVASDLTFILWIMEHRSNGFIFQSEYIAVAIAQALVGAIAMVLTIPLTSIICAFVYNKKNKNKELLEEE